MNLVNACILVLSVAPGDYISATTTITFPAGSIIQTASVQTVIDNINERLEKFSVQLSNPGGGLTLGPDILAQINIKDIHQNSKFRYKFTKYIGTFE